jgi:arginine-tRNA-protein transferase
VYRKYQVSIHKDSADKCSPDQFTRFLCNSSLIQKPNPIVDSHDKVLI